jgi:hypothetical protein
MMWSFLILTIATAILLFSSVFFKKPIDLQDWLKPSPAAILPNRITRLPAAKVLEIAYLESPPECLLKPRI